MARSTSLGPLDDGVELPWWAGFVFAAIVYVFLKWVFPSVSGSSAVLKPLAAGAQSSAGLWALIFLVLAGFSPLRAYRRRRLLDLETSLATIRALPQRRFEQFAAEAFEKEGHAVARCGSAGYERGIDFTLRRGQEKVLVQCRRWRSATIDSAPLRELHDLMAAEQASGCAFVTTGGYDEDALQFAAGKPIRLIGGRELEKMLRDVKRIADSTGGAHAHQSSLS